MIKLCVFVQRKPGMQKEQFKDYALNHHAQLVKSGPAELQPVRYCQNHVYDGLFNYVEEESTDPSGSLINRDSIVEIWRKDYQSIADFSASEFGGTIIPKDECNFANTKTTLASLTSELDLNLEPAENLCSSGKYKGFFVFEKRPAIEEDSFWEMLVSAIKQSLDIKDDFKRKTQQIILCKPLNKTRNHRTAHDDQITVSACVIFYFSSIEDSLMMKEYWNCLANSNRENPFFNHSHSFWLAASETEIISASQL